MTDNPEAMELADLKARRDALNAQIALIEDGQRKAAYDACMAKQLLTVNESRIAEGKPALSMAQFCSGVHDDE